MPQRFNEESTLFVSILKWFVLATVVGTIVGAITACFVKSLHWSIAYASRYPYYFLALPAALALNAFLLEHVVPSADAHSTDKVIEYIHQSKPIPWLSIPKAFGYPLLTIVAGGSAGKEAPGADIGAGLGSLFAGLFGFNAEDRRKLMICGVSAGFAAVFGTPIAGAIFGVEVLFVGGLLYEVLLPAFVAGVIGYQVSLAMGVTYFYHPLKFLPAFTEGFFIKVALAGIFFGLCAFLFIELMQWGTRLAAKYRVSSAMKGFVGGVLLVVLACVFSTKYLGLGLETVQDTLEGGRVPWYAFLLKSVCTSITLNCEGSGGIITPVFFVGATAGACFAMLLHLDTATFAAIGLVSLLAGAANTPIAASIMAVELFGSTVAPYAAVACVISFLMTGHRSVYPSQVLSIKKSSSIQVKLGGEIEGLEIQAPKTEFVLPDVFTKFRLAVKPGPKNAAPPADQTPPAPPADPVP